MQTLLNSYLDKFKKAHRMRRRLTCALLALALVVGTGVYWQLHLTGAAASNVVYCGLEEHTHTEDCYETVLVCTLEESGGHTHTEDCYEEQTVLTCTLEESQGHTHTEDCYNEAGELTCTLEESQGHTHTGDCYETEQVLTCALEESQGHTHTEDCYETQLVCTLEEHTHTVECLTDETADVETADDWKATLPELTGVWATDVVAIARSQLGYTESVANFTLDEDGETRKGYTRYGAWAGNQYGDWDAMFASFCLRYAGVSTEDFPEATGAYAWSVALTGAGLYESAEDCTPLPGDLVFLDEDGDGVIDAVGIVTGVDEDGGALTVIEGDYATANGDVVAENTYALGGSAIVGYGLLPEQESLLTAASEGGDDAEEAEEESNLLTAASVDPEEEGGLLTASEENGANELSTSTDLEDYVTDVSLKVLDGNEWKDVTTLSINEGDSVQVTLSYSVSNGMTGKTLTYTIPSTIAPTAATSGTIYGSDGKTVAGTYTITQNASGDWILTLTYSDSYDTTDAFSGTVTWTGTASVVTTQEDSYTQIGDTTITIVADKTTSDLSVDKTADYSNLSVSSSSTSMGYISYEVTASTILGTDGTVTITDTLNDSRNEFGRSWPGSWYDTSSVVLYVVDANGNKTEVDSSQYTVTYTNNYNDETDEALKEYQAKSGTAKYYPTLTISGLPELDAGYSYVLDYNVNVNVARKDANGTKTISNTVTASDTSNNGQDSTSKSVQSQIISKGGTYDAETNTITWTITVNSDGSYDLEGFQLGDVLDTTSNTLVGDIIITAADGTQKIISASDFFVSASDYKSGTGGYTFSTSDWTETELNGKFTITYTTAADGASGTVQNQAFIYTKDVYYGVTVSKGVGRGTISKTYDESASTTTVSGATYSWKITETAPTGQTSETLTDTIAQAVGEDGAGNTVTLPGSHYALLSTLWSEIQANLEVTIQLQGVTDAKSTTLTYAQFLAAGGTVSIVYYDENGDTATDSDAHVTSFAITVDTSSCTYYSATDPGSTCYLYKIELVYSTIADFSSAQAGYTYTISNEAASTALGTSSPYEVTFTPAGTIKKYAKTSTSTDYSEDNQSYKLGSGDDCIYYRLELTTDPDMNSAIVITDYLPEGVTLVETGTAVTVTVGTDTYAGVTYTAEAQSDGTTLLTITIPAGYNSSLAFGAAEGNTLYVYYAVSIAGDSYWDDAENASKTYINTASWGGLTADTNVTVTRNTSQLEKYGSITATPADGTGGTYDVAYRLLVNPGAEDLSTGSDEITLEDTLVLPSGATATLDYTSVKLYYYYYDYETYGDYTSDTSYGSVDLSTLTEVGSSLWSYSYDSANNKVTFTLPDEMAFLLVYTYKVDIGSANEVKVENTVVSGTSDSSESTVTINKVNTGAQVSQGKVVISKQDSTNAGTLLAGATFTLYAYNATSGEWDESVTLTTDTNGQIEVVVSKDQTDYFANAETSSVTVKTDTLYRLEETNAPSGYAVTDEIYYFIFTGENQTDGAAYQAATGVSSGDSITVTKPGGSGPETIAYDNVTFGSLTTSRSVAIGDEPTTITVVKNWYNSSNVALTDTEIAAVAPNGVQLQLYQVKDADGTEYDETVAYGSTVTVTASNSWTATWADLPKSGTEDVNGVSVDYTYTYYVQEVTQGNYVTTYTNNSGITSGTIGVINKVDYVDVSVSKVWVGDEDNTSDRPADVTVVLKANGTVYDTQTLDSGNSWSYTWTDLAKYSGGKEIEYTIEEGDVAYYVSEVTGDAATGFTVTNTYIARYNLPATGGAGGWTYGMVGLVLCGGVILVLYRRRNSS